jgi:hypothetical protein
LKCGICKEEVAPDGLVKLASMRAYSNHLNRLDSSFINIVSSKS